MYEGFIHHNTSKPDILDFLQERWPDMGWEIKKDDRYTYRTNRDLLLTVNPNQTDWEEYDVEWSIRVHHERLILTLYQDSLEGTHDKEAVSKDRLFQEIEYALTCACEDIQEIMVDLYEEVQAFTKERGGGDEQ